jgi:hypothetical protein
VLFAEDTPLWLIEAIRPDVLVKGAGYRPAEVVGADIVRRNGGRVLLVDLLADWKNYGDDHPGQGPCASRRVRVALRKTSPGEAIRIRLFIVVLAAPTGF